MTLIEAPIGSIKPDPNQPRKLFDDGEHDALTASVKQHGVLTPITLRKNGDGFVIVAGERRFRAAKAAKLKSIPAHVIEADPDVALVAGTVENVIRADLNPIEEGDAYRRISGDDTAPNAVERVAKLVNRPPERVADRIALSRLPDAIRECLANGVITIEAARFLVPIAQHNEQLAVALTWGVGNAAYDSRFLVENPAGALHRLEDADPSVRREPCEACGGEGYVGQQTEDGAEEWDDCPECDGHGVIERKVENVEPMPPYVAVMVNGHRALSGNVLNSLPDEASKRLKAAAKRAKGAYDERKAKAGEYGYVDRPPEPNLDGRELADAAVASGCAIRLGHHVYVTDPAWVAEYLPPAYEERVEAYVNPPKRQTSSAAKKDAPDDAEKAKRQKEREKERKAAEAARSFNVALGVALTTFQPKAQADVLASVKWLAHSVLAARDGDRHSVGECLASYQHLIEDGHPVERYKDGRWKKVKYPRPHQADAEQLHKRIDQAKTIEEVLAAILRPVLAAKLVKKDGLPGPDKPLFYPRHLEAAHEGDYVTGKAISFGKILDTLAGKLRVKQ